MSARLAKLSNAVHSIYVIEGPSGVYVGCSSRPEARWAQHKSGARGRSTSPLHVAMRRDGVDKYTFNVVAQSRGVHDAARVETDVIRQQCSLARVVLNMSKSAYHDVLRASVVNRHSAGESIESIAASIGYAPCSIRGSFLCSYRPMPDAALSTVLVPRNWRARRPVREQGAA